MPPNEQEIDETVDTGVQEGSEQPADQATEHAAEPTAADDQLQAIADEALAEARGAEPPKAEDEGDEAPEDDADEEKAAKAEDDAEDAGESEDEDHHLPDEEFQGLPKRARQRMGYLTKQRKLAETARDEAMQEIEQIKPAAEAFTTISTEMSKANLNGQELSAFLQFGAAYKRGDYARAKQIIEPFWQSISQNSGDVLDDHHQSLVDNGEVTEDHARQMQRQARELARRQQADQAAQRRQQQEAQQQQATQQQAALVEKVRAAGNDEMVKIRAEDPAFDQKFDDLKAEIEGMLKAYGPARSEDAARRMLRDAHERVTSRMAKQRPAKKATTPMPRSQGSPSVSKPLTDPMEIANQALRDHREGRL